jgi:multidrug efflux pump subunit AcrA (membrane-fusion protein)
MNVRLRFIFLMVIVGVVAGKWEDIMNHYDRWRRPAEAPDMVHAADAEYYCSMHPNVIRDEPGKCPFCGMPLSKRPKTSTRPALPEGVLAQVRLTPLKVYMGRIGTSPVEYRLLTREVRSVGIVDYDETRRATISARVKGRLDKLLVNYIGQKVNKGDALALIYSPELLVAQEELLGAARAVEAQKNAGGLNLEMAQTILDATKKKLLLWGLSDQQVEQILERGTPETHVTIYAPIAGIVTEKKALEGRYVMEGDELYTVADLGSVWLQAKVFESDIQGIAQGAAVEVASTAYPTEIFAGRITFIAFSVDRATRTVAARVEIANPEYKLKPGMYVMAAIRLPVGKVVEVEKATQPAAQPAEHTVPTDALSRAYLALAAAYAQDRADEGALKTLVKEAEGIARHLPEAAALVRQVRELEGKDLEAQRQGFKDVSQSMIKLLGRAPPKDELFVAHCPMVNADWVTATREIRNPYAGSQMLTCGSVTGSVRPEPTAVREDRRFAMGYFCPIYPDRLYEKPEQCPLDKFPFKYVKVEKVLAVPESAVIDTGTRKVAYRQSSPGTFDMVEVQLGARAGEFYPVLSGLKDGDEVAARGAFLVDAENRLNPAAGAQYFGATGGPQGGGAGPAGGHKH